MSDKALQDFAREAGVLVEWEDAAGRPQVVGPDTLRILLAALELPAASAREIADSRERLKQARRAAARTFLTADAGRPFQLPEPTGDTARLHPETGETRDLPVRDGKAVIDTPGYHRLEVGGHQLTVAVAPPRAFGLDDAAPGRSIWAAAVQLYSLRGSRPAPYGDFGALAEFARAAAGHGADAVAISPVHALFAADPGRYSPYGPSTRLFLNPAYADPAAVFDDVETPASDGGDLIDWQAATPARFAALRALHERFRSGGDARRDDFEAFRAAGGEDLKRHARFEALHAHFFTESGAGGWQGWPEPFRDAGGPAVEAFAREHAAEVDFHLFAQWLADRSLAAAQKDAVDAGMAVGLITDVAVGMDPGGSHAWSRPGDLLKGLSVGAPPDVFQADGQDWGLAAFSPQALAATGYSGFLATLRAAMRHAGGVRIDHAMALRRLWLSPHGAGAGEGAYLTYPLEDLLRLVALESHRHRAIVVGEDLGTVPPGFREALDARGVMGMRVLSFERTKDGGFIAPQTWSKEAAALTSTHDLPTLAGWWRGRDIDWAVKIGQSDTEADRRTERETDRERLWDACIDAGCAEGDAPPPEQPQKAVDAALCFVASARCRLAIIPIEDLLGLEEQPNLPGTTDQHPNWRRRLPAEADSLFSTPEVQARLRAINARRPA